MRSLPFPRAVIVLFVALLGSLSLAAAAAADPLVVRGRVLGPDGSALAGAEVSLLGLRSEDEAAAVAVTDERGHYRLETPGAGAWRVLAAAPGLVPSEFRLLPLLRSRSLADVRLLPDVGMTVRIADRDGDPVEGASATLATDDGPRRFGPPTPAWTTPVRHGVADATGTVRLARAAGGREALTVSAPGHAPVRRERLLGDAASVRLVPGAPRTLLVVDPGGEPVAGARVVLRGGHDLGATGADGRLGVSIPPDRVLEITVATDDGVSVAVRVSRAAEDGPRRIRLPATRLVAGRVLDAASRKPIAGAVVWRDGSPEQAVRTDRGGGFVVSAPIGTSTRLNAGAADYLRADPWPVAVADDGRPGPAIPLTPGATVEGVVVDEGGDPVAGATLRVEEKPTGGGMMRIRIESFGGGGPDVVTDDEGRFTLGPIDPDRPWIVHADAPGRAPASAPLDGLEPLRTRAGVRLVSPAGRSVVGRVVDAAGDPIPDAAITLTVDPAGGGHGFRIVRPGADAPPREAVADRDGRFEVTGVSPGTYGARAVREGFAPWSAAAIEVPERGPATDLGDVVLVPGETVLGLVVDENGDPVEGVAVRASEAGGGGGMMFVAAGASFTEDEADAVTGPDGWFTVSDLAPDRPVTLAFARDGYLDRSESEIALPADEPLEIVLQPSSVLAGTVLDPEGAPVPGASVTLTRTVNATMGNRMFSAISREDRPADGDGRFRFEGQRPGTVTLEASGSGWQDLTLDGVEIPRGEDVLDVELRLRPGAVLVGRVTAPDGRPVPGAQVAEVGSGGEGMIVMPGTGSASDGDGYYRLEGLEPGTRSIEVTHGSYVRTVKDLDAKPGINTLDFEFEGGQAVRGTVVDPDGAPVAGAFVQLPPAGQRWGGPEATTDGDGRFEIAGVGDGEYGLRASADGFAPYAGDQRVRVDGAPVDGLTVPLPAGAKITGRVIGIEPDRYGEVDIEAFGGEAGGFAGGRMTSTGEYVVEGAGPGAWRVEGRMSRSGRNASADVTIEAGQTEGRVDLDFGQGVTLSGRATIAGRAFGDAAVSASGIDVASSGIGHTDRDGSFRVEGLEPGTYRVDLRQWSTGIAHQREIEVTGDREVEIELPVARIAGTVLDASDRSALAGVRLALEPTEGRAPMPGFGPGAITDVEGTFRIENVPDGSWRLSVRRDGYASIARDVVVQEGRDVVDLDLRLDPTEGLALAARTPSGRAPDTVTVAVLDGAGRAVESGQFATGENGVVRLGRVPPGSWEVLVNAPGTGTARLSATAPGAAVEVRLPEACRLVVRVPELEPGGAIATARVVGADGVPFRRLGWFGSVDDDVRFSAGRLELDLLPPGDWTIQVTTADGRTWNGRATTSPAAPSEVVLE